MSAGTSTSEPANSDEALVHRLRQAQVLLDEGNPQRAIDEHLDPIIQHYLSRFETDRKRGYSARSQTEAMFYLILAAGTERLTRKDPGAESRDAVVVNSILSDAYFLKAFARVEQERFDEAREVIREALVLSPQFPSLWIESGAIAQHEGQWRDALSAYQEAEEAIDIVYPEESEERVHYLTRALRGQGYALIEMGELKKAEKLYKRCLKLNPDDDGAKGELAYIAKLRKQKKR